MKQLIQDFTDQLREANAIGSSYTFIHNYSDFQNICVCGLGDQVLVLILSMICARRDGSF